MTPNILAAILLQFGVFALRKCGQNYSFLGWFLCLLPVPVLSPMPEKFNTYCRLQNFGSNSVLV